MKIFSNDTLIKAINLGLIVLPIGKNDVNLLTNFEKRLLTYQLIDRLITIQNTRRMYNTLSVSFRKYKYIIYIIECSIILLILAVSGLFTLKEQDFSELVLPVVCMGIVYLINYIIKTMCLKKNIVEGTLMIDELYNLNNTYYN